MNGGTEMDVREKLVELIKKASYECDEWARDLYDMKEAADIIADFLITNGVTVQELGDCKYCKEYEDLPEHFIDGKPVGRVFDTCIQRNENGLWHLEVPCGTDIGIRFCPMCGRRLPQPPKGE